MRDNIDISNEGIVVVVVGLEYNRPTVTGVQGREN